MSEAHRDASLIFSPGLVAGNGLLSHLRRGARPLMKHDLPATLAPNPERAAKERRAPFRRSRTNASVGDEHNIRVQRAGFEVLNSSTILRLRAEQIEDLLLAIDSPRAAMFD